MVLGPCRPAPSDGHDYVIANYLCTSGKHYPLESRRFRKRAACAEDEPTSPFKNHTTLFKELVDGVVEREIPGDFAFDSYFSSAEEPQPYPGPQARLGGGSGDAGAQSPQSTDGAGPCVWLGS